MNTIHFTSINSTNDYLKVKYPFLNDWAIVYADYQEKGKGRINRSWESENKKNLLCSILIKDKKTINKATSLSLLVGTVVLKLLIKLGVKDVSIKWPNDVYVKNKKICGILLESVSIDDSIKAIIIGVGINLNQTEFNNELNATSYQLEKGKKIKIEKVLDLFIALLKRNINKLVVNKSKYIDIVNNNNFLLNKEAYITLNNKKEKVIVKDINNDNTLNVILNEKTTRINANEVSLIYK